MKSNKTKQNTTSKFEYLGLSVYRVNVRIDGGRRQRAVHVIWLNQRERPRGLTARERNLLLKLQIRSIPRLSVCELFVRVDATALQLHRANSILKLDYIHSKVSSVFFQITIACYYMRFGRLSIKLQCTTTVVTVLVGARMDLNKLLAWPEFITPTVYGVIFVNCQYACFPIDFSDTQDGSTMSSIIWDRRCHLWTYDFVARKRA